MRRNLEVLISSLEKDPVKLASHMNLECDAVIINQGSNEHSYEYGMSNGLTLRVFETKERGVGRSRNRAIDAADSKIVLFADDDIVYTKGYAEKVLNAFKEDPKADIIMFNFNVNAKRRTYFIEQETSVSRWTLGRYPAFAAAARLSSITNAKVRFSTLFGGGAKYSNGEDSLFFMECIKAGLKIKAVPVTIGSEEPRKSTWFNGYNEKFFKDRGVLFSFLYGKTAVLWAFRFAVAKRKLYMNSMKPSEAFKLMKQGIEEGNLIKKDNPNGR